MNEFQLALDDFLDSHNLIQTDNCYTKTITIGETCAKLNLYFRGYLSEMILGAFLHRDEDNAPYQISIYLISDFEVLLSHLQKHLPPMQIEKPFEFRITFPYKVFLCRSQGQIYVFDTSKSKGYIFLNKISSLDLRSYVTPFRLMMSWIVNEVGGELIHASAISQNGRVLVISGEKGSGKSTLALASGLYGSDILSDDAVAIIGERAYAIYSRAKIDANNIYTEQLLKHSFDLMSTQASKKIFPLSSFGRKFVCSGKVSSLIIPTRSNITKLLWGKSNNLRESFVLNSLREIFGGDSDNVSRLNNLVDTYDLVSFETSTNMKSNLEVLYGLLES